MIGISLPKKNNKIKVGDLVAIIGMVDQCPSKGFCYLDELNSRQVNSLLEVIEIHDDNETCRLEYFDKNKSSYRFRETCIEYLILIKKTRPIISLG